LGELRRGLKRTYLGEKQEGEEGEDGEDERMQYLSYNRIEELQNSQHHSTDHEEESTMGRKRRIQRVKGRVDEDGRAIHVL
jgi:hypothetical protein